MTLNTKFKSSLIAEISLLRGYIKTVLRRFKNPLRQFKDNLRLLSVHFKITAKTISTITSRQLISTQLGTTRLILVSTYVLFFLTIKLVSFTLNVRHNCIDGSNINNFVKI